YASTLAADVIRTDDRARNPASDRDTRLTWRSRRRLQRLAAACTKCGPHWRAGEQVCSGSEHEVDRGPRAGRPRRRPGGVGADSRADDGAVLELRTRPGVPPR